MDATESPSYPHTYKLMIEKRGADLHVQHVAFGDADSVPRVTAKIEVTYNAENALEAADLLSQSVVRVIREIENP